MAKSIISEKNPLFKSPTDSFGNTKFTLNAYSASDFEVRCKQVTYSINFQRYYLFNNPPGDAGADWQRRIFANMINYQPIGTIEWVNTIDETTGKRVGTECESMDGQQRTKTYLDIRENKVKLPKGAYIFIDGAKVDVGEFSFTRLWQEHQEYVVTWLQEYAFIVIESNLTKEEKHKRFTDVNNQNELSEQDIRSSHSNPLTDVLNPMVLSPKPWYDFLKVDTNKFEFNEMPKLPITGKTIQEVISKVLVFGFAGKYTNIGKGAIDSLYEDFNDNTKTKKDMDKIYPTLDEVMSTSNYVIKGSKQSDFWKKRDVMILMIVLWDLIANKKKFDSKLLKGGYQKAIAELKQLNAPLNKWALDNCYLVDMFSDHKDNKLANSIRERNNVFAGCYASGDSPITLQFVVETIKNKLYELGIITTKDSRRVFSKAEKQQVAHLQDCKCACCGEEIEVNNTSSYEGDHILEYSEGGKTTIDNCEILCLTCHQTKTKDKEHYLKLRKKYARLQSV